MSARPFRRTAPALASAVLALAFGCKKEDATAPSSPGNPPPVAARGGGPPSPGEMLFGQKGCVRCHSLGAQAGGPKGKGKGPDLSNVGADPAHTPEWIAEYVRDPHSKNPESKMPKQDESRVSDQELTTIAEYLSRLK